MDSDELIQQVADDADLPLESAEHVTKAIVGVLLDHLSGEDGEQLLDRLPVGLAEGVQPNKAATPMTVEEFLERVVASTEADEAAAERAARALFALLPEAVGDEEYERVQRQLDPTLKQLAA